MFFRLEHWRSGQLSGHLFGNDALPQCVRNQLVCGAHQEERQRQQQQHQRNIEDALVRRFGRPLLAAFVVAFVHAYACYNVFDKNVQQFKLFPAGVTEHNRSFQHFISTHTRAHKPKIVCGGRWVMVGEWAPHRHLILLARYT